MFGDFFEFFRRRLARSERLRVLRAPEFEGKRCYFVQRGRGKSFLVHAESADQAVKEFKQGHVLK